MKSLERRELAFGEDGASCDSSSQRIKGRLRAALSRRDVNMPEAIRKQFIGTLPMARSSREWIELEKGVSTELNYWDEIAAAKKKVRQAKAHFRRHATWPHGYDPDVDLVAEVGRRVGYSDWRP